MEHPSRKLWEPEESCWLSHGILGGRFSLPKPVPGTPDGGGGVSHPLELCKYHQVTQQLHPRCQSQKEGQIQQCCWIRECHPWKISEKQGSSSVIENILGSFLVVFSLSSPQQLRSALITFSCPSCPLAQSTETQRVRTLRWHDK